jgi:predicted RNase H-like nuclease (RuvC/YqgF family)
MPPSSTAALQAQIDNLGERMDRGFDEIKNLLRSYEERTRKVEQQEAGCQPVITSQIKSVFLELGKHDGRIEKLEKQLGRVMAMYSVFIFISGALGLSIIALIWAMITGQATVVFR